MSILWYAITYSPPLEWSRHVCFSVYTREMYWSPCNVYGCTCSNQPNFYFLFYFWIFDFWILMYCVEVTVRYRKLHTHYYQYKDHTIFFFDIFLFQARYHKIQLVMLYQPCPITYDAYITFANCDSRTSFCDSELFNLGTYVANII